MRARLAIVAVTVATAAVAAPSAHATRPPSLRVAPATVGANGTLSFIAYCPVNDRPASPVTSPGLAGPVPLTAHSSGEFVGVGKAGNNPGQFTATIRCPHWTPQVTTTFTVTRPTGS